MLSDVETWQIQGQQVWSVSPQTRREAKLQRVGSHFPGLDKTDLARTEYLTYPARDGTKIPAFLTKPVNKLELLTRVKSLLRVRHLKRELDRTMAYIHDIESRETKPKGDDDPPTE